MIRIQNLSFSYMEQNAGMLQDINLTIAEGECVLLCGRSGCGKTTITRLINGLIPNFFSGKASGSATVDGQPVAQLPMYELAKRIGSVFQNPRTQFFNVDTDSEIAFGIENEALPTAELARRVEETTNMLGLKSLRGRNIFELSGGEKQKIAFASIYAMQPDIYLLDEPSSNLDLQSIEELREHLRLVKSQGKTIVITEHRLYYLLDLADRIVYLENGRIERIMTKTEIAGLLPRQRALMGLRAVDLAAVHPDSKHSGLGAPVLELRDVSMQYKKRIILQHINLSAARGEVIGIVGRNGAGKSTFSRALCGLHRQCEGDFLWQGCPQEPKARLARSYMVMQDVNYQLFAESVERECSLGIKHPDHKLIDTAMEELGLDSYRERHPNTLSGGQKQRVAVAVSMVCGREILVFDEPTSGLDYDSMTQVAALIEKLTEMGKLIFVVTHDYEFICRSCTRILHFDDGALAHDFILSMESEEGLRTILGLKQNKEGGI